MRCAIDSDVDALRRGARLAGLALAGLVALASCRSEPGFHAKETLQGRSLVVTLICEEAMLEEAFVDYLAERFHDDTRAYPAFEEYRFRLSLIPEDAPNEGPVSVLFSYMFFDRQATSTSRVEAFEFLVPRVEAAAMSSAGPSARFQLYEDLRERQPVLNPNFARHRPEPEPSAEAISL